jgi:hypothetical protein
MAGHKQSKKKLDNDRDSALVCKSENMSSDVTAENLTVMSSEVKSTRFITKDGLTITITSNAPSQVAMDSFINTLYRYKGHSVAQQSECSTTNETVKGELND